MYHNFIGIDISKNDFCVALHCSNKVAKFENNNAGFVEFKQKYQQALSNALVVLEATGGYESALVKALHVANVAVHRADTRVVKSFIRSLSKLGKSAAIDARGLARYAKERYADLKIYIQPLNSEKELKALVNRETDLKQMIAQEKNRLQAPDNEFCRTSNEMLIKVLEKEVAELNQKQQLLIGKDRKLTAKVNMLSKEIAGVGNVTAIKLVSLLPELS